MKFDRGAAFTATLDQFPAGGGCAELWSQTAFVLAIEGFHVVAGVVEWSPLHPRMIEMQKRGIEVAEMHHVAADATLVFLIGAPRRGTLIDLTWGAGCHSFRRRLRINPIHR